MAGRLDYMPYDVDGAVASVLHPDDEDYEQDALSYGVDEPDGRLIVGIGASEPDVVLVGTKDQLASVARQILDRLDGA